MFISWQSVLKTCHWFCKLWELVSVLCHEVLSNCNCLQESCISTNFNHPILLWEPFLSFFVLLQQIFLWRIIGRRCRCFRQQSCWLKEWVRLSCQHGSPRSCLTSTVFLTIWDCSVDCCLTAMVVRKQFNRFNPFLHRHRSVLIIFHLPFAFERSSGQWTRGWGRLGVRFLRIWSSSVQRLCPILFVVYRYFFSDPGPRNDQRPAGFFFANIDTSVALALHSRSLSSDPHMMSLNIDMKTIRPRNCVGSTILFMNSWTLSTNCKSALRQLCPKFCNVVNLWTNSIFLPKQYLMLGSDSPFQDITQNLKIQKTLHSIDWWLLHHWPKMIVSMENSPNWFETLQKISHDCSNINCSSMSNICFIVRSFPVFLMECKFSEKFFPMNTDASIVEDTNIHQIVERLSMSFVASFEDCSNISQSIIHPVQEWQWL